jgi:Hydrogenase maturation protease
MRISSPILQALSGKGETINVDGVPGTVRLYRKADIMRHCPAVRMDPHSPALVETPLSTEMFGVAPRDLLLVGIAGGSYESGCNLSDAVNESIAQVIAEILAELRRLGVPYRLRKNPAETGIWWTAIQPSPELFADR